MKVWLNERLQSVPEGITAGKLRDEKKPGADVIIVNGYPAGKEKVLTEGDRVTLIVKGEIPDEAELEALMLARHTPGVHERMKQATVGIAAHHQANLAVSLLVDPARTVSRIPDVTE